jgi:hypothetical protein
MLASVLSGCAGRITADCTAPSPAAHSSAGSVAPPDSNARTWSFAGVIGTTPTDFEFLTTDGPPGQWMLRERVDAPSAPTVLAQEDGSRASGRFAIAVAKGVEYADGTVSVRCLALGGSIDRACGIVWRLRDAQNYYLARANALENNVRLYFVQAGSRHELASWNGTVASCTWNTLRITMTGDHVGVFWNDQQVIDSRDARFTNAGRIGVWTKADSRTLFDDLTVRNLR